METNQEKIIEERKEKFIKFFKNNPMWIWVGVVLLLIILGVYIRSQPMTDHGGNPGLWDVTTNSWTLGPDLDPFLFLRYAKTMVQTGSLPSMDMMRNVPLGFETNTELQMVSYMIVLTYKIINIFGEYSVDFAGVLMPVLFFVLIIVAFFLFVREIFTRKDDEKSYKKANWIATIATLFMIVIPEFLSRTVAGIPEKESIAFFFLFIALFLFLKSWKSEKTTNSLIWGVLSGVATGLMSLSWGAGAYIFIPIAVSALVAFILNKFNKNRAIGYATWIVVFPIVSLLFTSRYSIKGFLFGIDTGLSLLVLAALVIHFILWKTSLKETSILQKLNSKLPKNIISLLLVVIFALIAVLILQGPSYITNLISGFNDQLFNPVTGRWKTTVAENRQPYFTEWGNTFGPILGNFPIMFWIFIIGSVVLFKEMLSKLKNKDAWVLTVAFVFFLFALIFSRYSASSIFNGTNTISKLLYYLGIMVLFGTFIYHYYRHHKEKDDSLKNIDLEYVLLFVLFVLCLITSRSAVRLIMVLATITPIFLAYLNVNLFYKFMASEDSTKKIILGALLAILILLSLFTFFTYFNQVKQMSYGHVPYYYTNQWQEAMSWVRNNTPTNAVFAHWWDYGYWVQSIGNRATVTDGGNLIVYWNYLTGRHVLTGDNQKTALEVLYAHNATNLLIDSSDIGKYGAFSQIGSDENYDKLSSGPITMIADTKNIQELKDQIVRTYNIPAGNNQISISPLEEDINYNQNSTKLTYFKENSGVIGFSIAYSQNNNSIKFIQPQAIIYSQGNQISLPVRYLYYNNKMNDFGSGLEMAVYPISRVSSNSIDSLGALIYVSPRVLRGLLAQLYIFNDPFDKFDAFKLEHIEYDLVTGNLLSQNYNVSEFNYYDGIGLMGPIKIWEIKYKGNEKVNPEYVQRNFPSSINWQF